MIEISNKKNVDIPRVPINLLLVCLFQLLDSMVNQVCRMDKQYGWHKAALRRMGGINTPDKDKMR